MPPTVSEYEDDCLRGKTRACGKENCYSGLELCPSHSVRTSQDTELPSTSLTKFDVELWIGFSWITVCADILHTAMNQLHFIRKDDFIVTMNNHILFKNIMHVVFSRIISFHF